MSTEIFQAYSDESGINDRDRYTSVSIVSGKAEILGCLRDELANQICQKGIKEVKFVKVNSYKSPITQVARSFIDRALNDYCIFKQIRIDTITVDNQYLLSIFPNYDKGQKLEHMYYCVLSHIVRQWNNTKWYLYPDVNSKVNWNQITDYLNLTRLRKKQNNSPLLIEWMLKENPRFEFGEVKQLASINEPLIQLTDLFAGLARFSHEEQIDCSKWVMRQNNGWQSEMELVCDDIQSSMPQTKKCRYQIIGELYSLCNKHKLYVSIREKKYLWSRRPNQPINFWDWEYKKP